MVFTRDVGQVASAGHGDRRLLAAVLTDHYALAAGCRACAHGTRALDLERPATTGLPGSGIVNSGCAFRPIVTVTGNTLPGKLSRRKGCVAAVDTRLFGLAFAVPYKNSDRLSGREFCRRFR